MSVRILEGDCAAVLRELEAEAFDAMVTDPPAGIGFMGKDWDSDRGGRDAWIAWLSNIAADALRVLKPGAHALVWAIPRIIDPFGGTGRTAIAAVREVFDCTLIELEPEYCEIARAAVAHELGPLFAEGGK